VRCRKIFAGHDDGRRVRGETNRLEVAFGVILDIWREHRRSDMRSHATSQQSIAVRLRGGDARAAQCATSTTNVLNDHLLAKRSAHMFSHNTRHDITRAAGWEWDNDSDGLRRISLCKASVRHAAQSKNGEGHQTCDQRTHPACSSYKLS